MYIHQVDPNRIPIFNKPESRPGGDFLQDTDEENAELHVEEAIDPENLPLIDLSDISDIEHYEEKYRNSIVEHSYTVHRDKYGSFKDMIYYGHNSDAIYELGAIIRPLGLVPPDGIYVNNRPAPIIEKPQARIFDMFCVKDLRRNLTDNYNSPRVWNMNYDYLKEFLKMNQDIPFSISRKGKPLIKNTFNRIVFDDATLIHLGYAYLRNYLKFFIAETRKFYSLDRLAIRDYIEAFPTLEMSVEMASILELFLDISPHIYYNLREVLDKENYQQVSDSFNETAYAISKITEDTSLLENFHEAVTNKCWDMLELEHDNSYLVRVSSYGDYRVANWKYLKEKRKLKK